MNTINKNSNIQSYNKRLAYLFGTALLVAAAYSSFSQPANASAECYLNTDMYALCQRHWIVR